MLRNVSCLLTADELENFKTKVSGLESSSFFFLFVIML